MKKKKLFWGLGLGFLVVIIGVIVAIIIINTRPKDSGEFTAEQTNIGISFGSEIEQKYDTDENYLSSDAVADFEKRLEDCKSSICKVYVSMAYMDFVYLHYDNVDRATDVMLAIENEVKDVPQTVAIDYYVALRDFAKELGSEYELVYEYYKSFVEELLSGKTAKQILDERMPKSELKSVIEQDDAGEDEDEGED